nr:gamma-glutamyltransferase [Hankyongella ginsenosidimutans]
MRFQDTIGLLVCALLAGGAAQAQVEPNETKASRTVELARAKHYMAAAANPLAADAGREMLAKGGSAADAAIAMQLVLSLVEPQSSGVSGGGFAVVYDAATGQTTSIDGRETARRRGRAAVPEPGRDAGLDPRRHSGRPGSRHAGHVPSA